MIIHVHLFNLCNVAKTGTLYWKVTSLSHCTTKQWDKKNAQKSHFCPSTLSFHQYLRPLCLHPLDPLTNNYNIHFTWYMCWQINTDKLLAGFSGTFHTVTVSLICVFLVSFYLHNYFKKFRRLEIKIKLRTLESQNLVLFFIFAKLNCENKTQRNTFLPKSRD